ncbi:hypothetical protein SARC_07588 [Sphaeroforma arctica JP610]|uniref:Uncharacterized protein n=1 Tax=Sphaeroforma arctica JP610 TaxID=667725 RepID=A0A0L0FTC9_9EUKA|nr:hypothetical protein SARC_07588 [Sphaeroforma arctica JP610]KNC80042.1 hypothetical protein SARC_07588 [Sphaeroforma arctica JP610]|eukprot:XP_014153944.1 hypothetical protein SARC_07588 [Sphaeroforma arctica JP610]
MTNDTTACHSTLLSGASMESIIRDILPDCETEEIQLTQVQHKSHIPSGMKLSDLICDQSRQRERSKSMNSKPNKPFLDKWATRVRSLDVTMIGKIKANSQIELENSQQATYIHSKEIYATPDATFKEKRSSDNGRDEKLVAKLNSPKELFRKLRHSVRRMAQQHKSCEIVIPSTLKKTSACV